MTEFIACVNSTMSNANCVQVALQYVTVIQYFISRSKFRPVWCIGWSSCSTAQEGNGSTISATFHCFQPYKLLYWHASCKLCLLHYKKDLLLPTSYVGEQMWLTVGISVWKLFFHLSLCFQFFASILDFNQPQSSLCYCSQYQMQWACFMVNARCFFSSLLTRMAILQYELHIHDLGVNIGILSRVPFTFLVILFLVLMQTVELVVLLKPITSAKEIPGK